MGVYGETEREKGNLDIYQKIIKAALKLLAIY